MIPSLPPHDPIAPGESSTLEAPAARAIDHGISVANKTDMAYDDTAGEGRHAREPVVRVMTSRRATLVLRSVDGQGTPRSSQAVQYQREAARDALRRCAAMLNAPIDGWLQRPNGAPQPNDGWHWSISHKRRWAAAAISREPVGLDLESVEPRRTPLFEEIGKDREWTIAGGRNWPAFYRMWTAKEAVLKANGCGIGELERCRVLHATRSDDWIVTFQNDPWCVEHLAFDDHHLLAVALPATAATDTSPRHWV